MNDEDRTMFGIKIRLQMWLVSISWCSYTYLTTVFVNSSVNNIMSAVNIWPYYTENNEMNERERDRNIVRKLFSQYKKYNTKVLDMNCVWAHWKLKIH